MPRHISIGSYLGDVLALKLGEESLQAVIVGLNTDGRKDVLNVLGRRRVVASEAEEETLSSTFKHCEYREGGNAPELIMDSCYIGTVWTHRLSVKETREINQFNRKLGGD
ncbi:hypothetical protein VCV18_010385 [Metarhizium anisopliae]